MGVLVGRKYLAGGTLGPDASVLQPDHTFTDIRDLIGVVADEDHRSTFSMKALDRLQAALLELPVDDGEHLVEYVDVGRELHCHREGEPGGHAAGEALHRRVHMTLELGESGNRIHLRLDHPA